MIETNKELLFIGGDLSGIQKFIYNISSKKAMVSLKGRSAYLSDYTRELCYGILELDQLKESTIKEVIYCSGGKFYLIVEDVPGGRKSLEKYFSACEKDLWKEHKGQLGLAITYVPFRFAEGGGIMIDGCRYDKIGELWARISDQFARMKNRKFLSVIKEGYSSFFEVLPDGGETRVCAITGIEDKDCVRLEKDEDGEEIWVLPSVLRQVKIGKKLRAEEGFKTLEEYAEGSYLGVLRMDVDGLGVRFVKGFNSFDEYSSFSNKLSAFFDTKLKIILKNYQNHLNIVYAGGDDLFVVGRWDKVIEFAAEIHDKFDEHMAGESITISGGMAIVSAKFPIAKSAEISGEAEDKAKQYRGGQKNAFSFLGECVGWGQEFNSVKGMKDELVRQVCDNGVSRGLLHQLMRYAEMAAEGKDLSYKWHETYYLSRMISRCGRNDQEKKKYLTELRAAGLSRKKEEYRLLALAARWAELLLRSENNNKQNS